MLRTRVIPIVLIDGFSVVKTIQFDERRNQGSPITVARTYNTRNVDELILLDIEATKEDRTIDLDTIEAISSECFMPLTIGGGVRTVQDIRNLLDRGADKVAINTAAIEMPSLVSDAVFNFGSQCIVGSIDVKKVDSSYFVYSKGTTIELDPIEWAVKLETLGVGELLINSVDQDGVMKGCDIELIGSIVKAVSIPVIYAGGVGTPEDYLTPLKLGCSSVAASSIFHFTRWTPNCIKKRLGEDSIPVRLL